MSVPKFGTHWAHSPQEAKYSGHPGMWAYKEFEEWCQKNSRIPDDQKHAITRQFKTVHDQIRDIPQAKAQQLNDRIAGMRSGIDPRTLPFIQGKAEAIFAQEDLLRRQGHPARTSAAAAAPSGAPDDRKIEQLAKAHGFIWFYKAPENSLTACFGNFYEMPGGVLGCKTAEGAFQAQKFVDEPFALFAQLDGDGAWRLGRSYPGTIKAGWSDGVRENAMRRVIHAKFAPGSALAGTLLATQDAYLAEHNPVKGRDTFWSDDSDGTGRNMLGQLLMERRGELGGTGIVAAPQAYFTNVRNLH